jgi:hypothetical protein
MVVTATVATIHDYLHHTRRQKMQQSRSEQFAREIRDITRNLSAPLNDAVGNSVEAALEFVSTVTSGIGQVGGAFLDEARRVTDKICPASPR